MMADHIIYGCGFRWGLCTRKSQPHTCNKSVRVTNEFYSEAKKKPHRIFMKLMDAQCKKHRCKDCGVNK